jgi:hypothetical protein
MAPGMQCSISVPRNIFMPDLITLLLEATILSELALRGIPPDYYKENEDPLGTSDLAPCLGFLSFFADFQQLCLTMMPPCDVPRAWSAATLAWL